MSGPEHYAEAERVLRKLQTATGLSNAERAELRALAALHASLAQTAALLEVANASTQGARAVHWLAPGWPSAVRPIDEGAS